MASKSKDHLQIVSELPDKINEKKTKPRLMAVVDEDNCTGCSACVPFCPVDCIEPVPINKHEFPPIPPVHVRDNECIGCQICARVCTKLTWHAIRMMDTDDYEKRFDRTID